MSQFLADSGEGCFRRAGRHILRLEDERQREERSKASLKLDVKHCAPLAGGACVGKAFQTCLLRNRTRQNYRNQNLNGAQANLKEWLRLIETCGPKSLAGASVD